MLKKEATTAMASASTDDFELQSLSSDDTDADAEEGGATAASSSSAAAASAAAAAPRVGVAAYLGIVMAIMSSFFFSLSSLIVKLVPDVHPVALATYRFAGILLPSVPIVIRRAEDPFPRGKRLLLLLR